MKMKTLCRFSGENDIWIADYTRRIFGVSAGLFIDSEFNIYDCEDGFVPHPESHPALERAEAKYELERREHISNVCSGLSAFSTTEICEEAEDVFGTFGFRDEQGEVAIEPQYLSAGEFSNRLCPVCVGKTVYRDGTGAHRCQTHWGYIDTTGRMVIPPRFRQARSFNKYGVAVVRDEWGSPAYLIDTAGKKVENSEFCYLSPYYDYKNRFIEFSPNKNSPSNDTGEFGLYDTKERRIMFPPRADAFFEWDENCILVQEHGTMGPPDRRERYIDSCGNDLYPWQTGKGFAEVKRPNELGISIVARAKFIEIAGGKAKRYRRELCYGLLDCSGVLIADTEYSSIRDLGHNIFSCAKGNYITVLEISE